MYDISIIVPIYNAEKYLKKCIDSLINQTKKEIEIILINDGSTDNSEKIIKKYKDDRIKYYKNKNQGIGKTRNFGIEKATGKYIMFVDSDDYIEKNACELLYEKANKEKLDLVVCDFYRVYNSDNVVEEKIESFNNSTLKKNPKLINIINMSPWNKLYDSKMIKENNIRFNEKLKYEDTPFVFMCIEKSKKIGKLNKCLNFYVIHSNSETTVRDEKVFDILEIVKIIRNNLKEEDYLKEELNKWTVRTLTNYTIQQRVQKDKKTAMKFIDESFTYLKNNIPDYKKRKYYENRSIFKYIIEKNILLTKMYVKSYRVINN